MRAIEKAREWAKETGSELDELIAHCIESGCVFIEPDMVLLGEDMGDAWLVYLLVGNPRYAMATAPTPRPWVEFERIRKDKSSETIRIRWETFERLLPKLLT